MATPNFEHAVQEFGRVLGITGLAPAAAGVCQLVFDGKYVLHLLHVGARDLMLLSCQLDEVACGPVQAALMARANFMQAGRGAVLCQGPDSQAYLQIAVPLAECSGQVLLDATEALLDQADIWSERLRRAAADPAPFDLRPGPPAFLNPA